ncbi:MAG TPA: hypothetical protein VFP33_12025 [Gallionella sp.]|nr:hypothetical protein [Gallionella sp.]
MDTVPDSPACPGKDGWRDSLLFPLMVFTVFGGLTLVPLWGQAGWPLNHEMLAFAIRTQIYAQHYSFLDFLPVWSSLDNEGFGSPQPLLYHKLFYVVSASLLGMTGGMKAALEMAILVFLVVGATGMYRTLRLVGSSREAGLAGGLAIIVANYTVTDWLIRGALAELAAAMLVPWSLFYLLLSLREERIHPGLAVNLGLIFLAHSVICFYLILLFSVTILVLLASRHVRPSVVSARSILLPAVIFLVLVSPWLLAMSVFGNDYDMARMLTHSYHPNSQFQPIGRYFWDSLWSFGKKWEGFTVQLDLPTLALMVAGLAGLFHHRHAALAASELRERHLTTILPVIFVGALAFLLQLPFSAPFYAHFPGAGFIQFPWRLLCVITPAIIIIGLYLIEKTFPHRLSGFILASYLIIMIITCGAFAPIKYQRFPDLNYPPDHIQFSVFGEYIPKEVSLPPPARENILEGVRTAGCHLNGNRASVEVKQLQFRVECSRPALLALPVFSSPLHGVVVSSPDGTSTPSACKSAPGFSGLCGVVVPAGQSRVYVDMPSYSAAIKWWSRITTGTTASLFH